MEKKYIANDVGVCLNPDLEWHFEKNAERASIHYGKTENGKWDYSITINLRDGGETGPVMNGTWDTQEICITASHAAMMARLEKKIEQEGDKYPFLKKALEDLKAHIADKQQTTLF